MLFEKPSVNLSMAATRRSARISGRAKTQPPQASEPSPSNKSPRPPRIKRKSSATTGEEAAEPKTPPPKKRALGHDGRPPTTALPSSAKLLYQPQEGNASDIARSKLANRLADPNLTNATLLSPETARLVASREVEEEPSTPSKSSSLGTARPTTQTLLREACEHLIRVDARMKPLIDKVECAIFTPEGLVAVVDPFESLASSIISQQVSGAAAKSIKAKFVALFDHDDENNNRRFPPPSKVAACSVERLREAGLSQRKAEYIQGLAEKFASGEFTTRMLHDAPYEELVEKLVAVRGLGKWSVEMFALFGLKRMDVFSLGDLGVQRGCAAFVGRDVAKLKAKGGKWKYMSEQDMLELSSPFAPYRSLFMWYMWQVEAVDISVLE